MPNYRIVGEDDPDLPGQCSRMEPGRLLIPVCLSVEYSVKIPLWGDWPPDTRLPDELRDRLAAWQAEFDEQFHWESGWRSKAAREHWMSQAGDLADTLREVLKGRAELEVNLWPVADEERDPAGPSG